MAYRVDDIEIPHDSPFANDDLGRKPLVDFLTGLIGRLEGPFVLAIDSPWGTGKTTLIKMLAAELERQDFQCVQFNAWKVDYVTDPLVALVSSIDRVNLGDISAEAAFHDSLSKVKKVVKVLAKRTVLAGTKMATFGVLDAEKEVETVAAELAGNLSNDLFDSFERERNLLETFRNDLAKAISQLSRAGKKTNLVFFIDELDRCRPTFAIELLERIKHMFDVPNLVFVLSIDKRQLQAITAAVYGQGIDAPEYLRRFIDLEMGIPEANSKQFTERLVTRFGLDPIFAERKGSESRYDKGNFIDFFTAVGDALGLTLRARERCITRLSVVMDQTPSNQYLEPVLVALLIALRTKEPEMFRKVVEGRAAPSETMDFLLDRVSPVASLDARVLLVIKACLIVEDPDRKRRQAKYDELHATATNNQLDEASRSDAKDLLEMIRAFDSGMRMGRRMRSLATKIDLAAMVRD